MSGPPPDDLKSWSKNDLIRELRRQRAINHEHAEQVAAAHSGGGIVDVAGDPHAQGGALIDARGAVLMDHVDVVLIDRKTEQDPLAMMLKLAGRVNYSTERADTAYLFAGDGAAAIVTQIVGLAHRAAASNTPDGLAFATDFELAMKHRTGEMT